jgi:hypothetical protein
VTTCNYNSLTGLHTLQLTVTAAHIKSSMSSLQLTPRLAAIVLKPPSLRYTDSLTIDCSSESDLYYDRRSVCQSVLVSSPHLGLMTKFLLLSDHCGFLIWGALSDERTGLSFTMYNIFYCLRFETPPTWRTRSLYLYPPGTGWPGYTPRHLPGVGVTVIQKAVPPGWDSTIAL